MDWFKSNRRFAVIVGVTVAVPLLLVLSVLGDLWSVRAEYQHNIDRLEPRLARQRGLINSREELQESALKVDSALLKLVYPSVDDSSTIAAALQTRVRQLMAESGMAVGNSRILPVRVEDDFERIGLNLTISGEMLALDQALTELSAYTPAVFIESIEIKPGRVSQRGANPSQLAVVTLQLLTLRATK